MTIHLQGTVEKEQRWEDQLSPREIVSELDRFIVGQHRAKRAVAIALRNRIRRQKLSPEMAEEVAPKNIIMIGPTGVGKTEIARRLARLARSPFMKVEASKFTEVGYVGRDVESMIRDLTEIAVDLVKNEANRHVHTKAEQNVEQRLLDLLLPPAMPQPNMPGDQAPGAVQGNEMSGTREKLLTQLQAGRLEERQVEVEVSESGMPNMQIFTNQGVENMGIDMKQMFPQLFGGKKKRRKMTIGEARQHLLEEEESKLVDMDKVTRQALERVQQSGIIFLDEIDKVAGRESSHGPDVSREGVQRDILPIVEGTTVQTKYGLVRTDHILFIAAGAFHMSKPADLIPELQGRFPIRVELESLGAEEFVRILTEPQNALIKQYEALMETEGIELIFHEEAIREVAEFAAMVNSRTENIGARRLHTIMEKLLDEISFEGADLRQKTVEIDREYVRRMLADIIEDQDLSRYIL